MRRIAVLVGAKMIPPPGRQALRFAHDDASELAEVLQRVGAFAAGDVHVLLDPHPARSSWPPSTQRRRSPPGPTSCSSSTTRGTPTGRRCSRTGRPYRSPTCARASSTFGRASGSASSTRVAGELDAVQRPDRGAAARHGRLAERGDGGDGARVVELGLRGRPRGERRARPASTHYFAAGLRGRGSSGDGSHAPGGLRVRPRAHGARQRAPGEDAAAPRASRSAFTAGRTSC